jgi:hypothetical protein
MKGAAEAAPFLLRARTAHVAPIDRLLSVRVRARTAQILWCNPDYQAHSLERAEQGESCSHQDGFQTGATVMEKAEVLRTKGAAMRRTAQRQHGRWCREFFCRTIPTVCI